jgi:colanic acid/amylovoran biosynthesis protein WcaK/AmsJ
MRHVVITNQHGDNRGDEAAMLAMLAGLEARLAPVRFTVLHQFADPKLPIAPTQDVEFLPLAPRSPRELLGVAAWTTATVLGVRRDGLLGPVGRRMVAAYSAADLVVSAPGGPYFGDRYASHEIVHWYHVWLAGRLGAPVFLYAPSVGPFRRRGLNWIRRRMFRRFEAPLTVREPQSAEYLRALLGDEPVEVTADSALQERYPPYDRAEWFGPERRELADRFVVSVSAIDFRVPGEPDASGRRDAYVAAMRRAIEHVHDGRPSHFVFLPQLYGTVHADRPFLERLARGLRADVSWEIVDPDLDSVGHRRVVAMSDLCVASRYHPFVFAVSAHVPAVCIYYEHKALGLAEDVGLAGHALDIRSLDVARLLEVVDATLADAGSLRAALEAREPELRRRAARTSELAAAAARPPMP